MIESQIFNKLAGINLEQSENIQLQLAGPTKKTIGIIVDLHDFPKKFYNEMAALSYIDEEIVELFDNSQITMLKLITRTAGSDRGFNA